MSELLIACLDCELRTIWECGDRQSPLWIESGDYGRRTPILDTLNILPYLVAMSLQDDLKQTRPFASKAQEATIAILRTAHVVRRRFEAAAERDGITAQQYNVLRILRGARGPLPTMEIAERMIEPTPGITRLVNSLEQRYLLRREQWAGDRRQVLCQITPAGLRLLEQLEDVMNELDEEIVRKLSSAELETLISLLERVRQD